jgi:hypothetical protein
MDNNCKTSVERAMGQINKIKTIIDTVNEDSQSSLRSRNNPFREKIMEIRTSS